MFGQTKETGRCIYKLVMSQKKYRNMLKKLERKSYASTITEDRKARCYYQVHNTRFLKSLL
jgi:hypothetical protein